MKNKSRYTPAERAAIYRKALKGLLGEVQLDKRDHQFLHNFELDWQQQNSGLCELLKLVSEFERRNEIGDKELVAMFPEFSLFKPTRRKLFWWDMEDRKARMNCLLFCIEMAKAASE